MIYKTWRYKLPQTYKTYFAMLEGIYFNSNFLDIDNGFITIPKDYAWDGCSPTYALRIPYVLPTSLYIGPWDGPKGSNGLPTMFYPSLVHDAFCQYSKHIEGLKKAHTVDIFREMALHAKSPKPLVQTYCFFIDKFGPQNWLGDKK